MYYNQFMNIFKAGYHLRPSSTLLLFPSEPSAGPLIRGLLLALPLPRDAQHFLVLHPFSQAHDIIQSPAVFDVWIRALLQKKYQP